jgi:type IV pilus assembly protein PilA
MNPKPGENLRSAVRVVLICVACVLLLMVVASLFVGGYPHEVARAHFSEGMTLTEGPRHALGRHHRSHGRMPRSHAEAGLPVPASIFGRYVKRVEWKSAGALVVTFKAAGSVATPLVGRTIWFLPRGDKGVITWRCVSDAPAKYCPSSCTCR